MRTLLPRPVSIPHRATLVIAAVLGMAACAPQAPAPPPAPSALTIYPPQGQSQAQQNKDKGECTNTANTNATSSETWAQIFAECMSGRGYGVE